MSFCLSVRLQNTNVQIYKNSFCPFAHFDFWFYYFFLFDFLFFFNSLASYGCCPWYLYNNDYNIKCFADIKTTYLYYILLKIKFLNSSNFLNILAASTLASKDIEYQRLCWKTKIAWNHFRSYDRLPSYLHSFQGSFSWNEFLIW